MAKVRDRDRGYNALMKRMSGAPAATVTVGIHEAEGSATENEGGMSVAEVATLHEFGLGGQEERSFIRAYVDENVDTIKSDLRKLSQAVVKGTLDSPEQALERFGLKTVGAIQTRISDGRVTPGLKESTIAKKGSSVPLLDDGILRSSITHKVEK